MSERKPEFVECYFRCGNDVQMVKENEIQAGINGCAWACCACRAWMLS
jgi:hypothetical protein